MPNIFDDTPSNEPEINVDDITLDVLVGEDRKYKSPDELAKAYAHAEAFIAAQKADKIRLEAENKVLKDLTETPRNPPVEPSKAPDGQNHDDPAAEPNRENEEKKDLSALIKEELDRAKQETSFADNVNAVSEKLASYYGDSRKAQEAIAKKAQELNVSTKWLMDIAGTTPSAFYGIVGIDAKSLSTPVSEGDVNTAAFGRQTNKKGFRYYEEIRKNEPKRYWSSEIQREMYAQARQLGEAFYT